MTPASTLAPGERMLLDHYLPHCDFVERHATFVRATPERTSGERARTKFRLYWMVIRPWSGLIRRLMLRAIRAEAER